ncbi:hypothetical protein PENARI_c028G10319 [Penicillium arizonense]|uniref:Uncharacterized protein n=1 Tax=Penicillium arizonense TaxID=1835702 RepID=A0A1F5L5P8_PENAI|nr:hypothetical protein PENARI_c028G10319 [Penicillium arizonense]OGE48522.1 hypothetical protein PENARI_c028G10319 [Penicillium arizonense]
MIGQILEPWVESTLLFATLARRFRDDSPLLAARENLVAAALYKGPWDIQPKRTSDLNNLLTKFYLSDVVFLNSRGYQQTKMDGNQVEDTCLLAARIRSIDVHETASNPPMAYPGRVVAEREGLTRDMVHPDVELAATP